MARVTILDTTSTGFIPYYSGAHTAYVDSTGAGGVYANSGLHEAFVIAASTDLNDITTGIKASDLSTIIFSSANIITGTTGQGDIRGTGDGYFHGGTLASKSLDPSSVYFHGLYVPLTGSAGLGGGITTGILGSGASTTPYTGSFTTDKVIHDFIPTFDTTTKTGSGIYTDQTLNLGLEFRDRADQEIDETHELIDNPFISGINIDVLNIDKSIAKSEFKKAYKESNLIFSPADNENVFGEFTTNFGIRTKTVNFNGLISTGEIFLYGNRIEIDSIRVIDGTGQFLDENPINFIAPETGFLNSLAFTNRQKVNNFSIKGAINFAVQLNSVNANYKNLEIYGTEGDIDTLVLNDISRKAVIDITNPPFVRFSLNTDNGLDYNTDYHFKIIPSSDLETGRAWTIGPYRMTSNQEANVNAFNDGVDDQSKRGGAAFGTDEDLDPNARFAVGGAVGRTLLVTKVDSNGNAGDVGIATDNPQQPLDAANVARANIAASDTTILGTDSAALAGSGHVISGNDNVVVGGETASISGGNFNFIGGGSGINVDHGTFSTSIGGNNNDIFSGDYSVIGGGLNNLISGIASDSHVDKVAILGGENNKVISAPYSFIGGGNINTITGTTSVYSSLLGGFGNNIKQSQYSAILGGNANLVESSDYGIILGGVSNKVQSAPYGLAAGRRSTVQSDHDGAFVFSDSQDVETLSSGGNTLNLSFQSGVFVESESGIYINGNPVVTGDSSSEGDTLQTVTSRGNTTSTSILSTGPHISGVTGLYSGNVGIGTDSPAPTSAGRKALHVKDTSNGAEIRAEGNGSTVNIKALSEGFIGTQGADKFHLQTNNSNRITINTDGHVGIGTTTPLSDLTVYSSDDNSATASIHSINNNETGALLRLVEGSNHQGGFLQYDGSANKFNIGVHNSNDTTFANDTKAITIDRTNANVGIGTTSPATELTVIGNISGSGDFLGTGDDGRITKNHVPYLVSGDVVETLQTVTNRGATTTNNIEVGNLLLKKENIAPKLNISRSGYDASTNDSLGVVQFNAPFSDIQSGVGAIEVKTNSTTAATDMSFSVRTGGANEATGFTIHGASDGVRVGIGTTSPATMLQVTDVISGSGLDISKGQTGHDIGYANIGIATMGTIGFDNHAGFHHSDITANAGSKYALMQDDNGKTFLNSAPSQQIRFCQGNILKGGFADNSDFFIDTDTLFVDVSEKNVGIETSSPDTTLDINGSLSLGLTAVDNSDHTVTSTDYCIMMHSMSQGRTVTIPSAQRSVGRILVIKDRDGNASSNNITIDPEGSVTIDNSATYTIGESAGFVMLICDGTNWFIIGRDFN